jgi:hypothetical protein
MKSHAAANTWFLEGIIWIHCFLDNVLAHLVHSYTERCVEVARDNLEWLLRPPLRLLRVELQRSLSFAAHNTLPDPGS